MQPQNMDISKGRELVEATAGECLGERVDWALLIRVAVEEKKK